MIATITAQQVKELRAKTGAGVVDAKEALQETDGDSEEAITLLQKKGAAIAAKKANRQANEGIIEAYIHNNNRVGVLLELNCETDFVAKNEEFKELAHDLAMHIAAMDPQIIHPEDLPTEELEKQKDIIKEQLKEEKKPDDILEKIIEGKLKKFADEQALLSQAFVKNPDQTVEERITEAIGKIGENIQVHQFARFDIKGTTTMCEFPKE